jgi:hypothetical protein
MSNNQHLEDDPQKDANQNNKMSNDPADGNRTSFTVGKDGSSPVEKAPPDDEQDQSMIETFGEEGAGIAAKE